MINLAIKPTEVKSPRVLTKHWPTACILRHTVFTGKSSQWWNDCETAYPRYSARWKNAWIQHSLFI